MLGLPGRGLVTPVLSDTPYVGKGRGEIDEQGCLRIYPDANVAQASGAQMYEFPTPVRETNPLGSSRDGWRGFALTRGASVRLSAVALMASRYGADAAS